MNIKPHLKNIALKPITSYFILFIFLALFKHYLCDVTMLSCFKKSKDFFVDLYFVFYLNITSKFQITIITTRHF